MMQSLIYIYQLYSFMFKYLSENNQMVTVSPYTINKSPIDKMEKIINAILFFVNIYF